MSQLLDIFVQNFSPMAFNAKYLLVTTWVLAVLSFSQTATAQDESEPIFKDLSSKINTKAIRFSPLLQVGYTLNGTENGPGSFNISTMRLNLTGELDGGFGYQFQPDLAVTPGILDANVYWEANKHFRATVGLIKTQFSHEFILPASNIDFVNRSRVVVNLAPLRQLGFNFSGHFANDLLKYDVGFFNGNGRVIGGDDNDKHMYVARLSSEPINEKNESLKMGIGAYTNETFHSPVLAGLLTVIAPGIQNFVGGDIRYETNKMVLAGEFIRGSVKPVENGVGQTTAQNGFYTTAAYKFTPQYWVLGRLDQFNDGLNGVSNMALLGINIFPTSVTEIQLSYGINADNKFDFNNNTLWVSFQMGYW